MPPKRLPPRLPLETFTSNSESNQPDGNRSTPLMVIDPHVLIPITDQSDQIQFSLNSWNHSIQEFHSNVLSQSKPDESSFRGFIYMHQQPNWLSQSPSHDSNQSQLSQNWLEEKEKIIRIDQQLSHFGTGKPLAQVIWAPLHEGEKVLEQYLNDIHYEKTNIKITGCCHLIQSNKSNFHDPKNNDLINSNLVNGIKLLGKLGLNLEFFVESNLDRSATSVLDDVLEFVSAVRENQDPEHQTKFILCHMGMPEMITSQSKIHSSVSCSSILSRLFSLSLFSNFEIKLTSLPIKPDQELNERIIERFKLKNLNQSKDEEKMTMTTIINSKVIIENDDNDDNTLEECDKFNLNQSEADWREMKKRIKFYLEPILEAFGDHRVMYCSGFPYFDSPNEGSPPSISNPAIRYQYQFEILQECLNEFGLKNHALDNVFGLNAQRCYGI